MRILVKNDSSVYGQIQSSVAPREAVQREMNNFAQNPHENNHGLQRQKQPKRWFVPMEIFPPLMKLTLCQLSDTFAIAGYLVNVSHPPSLHAVWKTVSCDEVAEHSLICFGSLPFIGGWMLFKTRCKCKAQIWHRQKTWHIKSKKSIAAIRQIDDWKKP